MLTFNSVGTIWLQEKTVRYDITQNIAIRYDTPPVALFVDDADSD